MKFITIFFYSNIFSRLKETLVISKCSLFKRSMYNNSSASKITNFLKFLTFLLHSIPFQQVQKWKLESCINH